MDIGSYIVAILVVGVLIIVHEAGHYLVALRSGMRVRAFSIGFGPSLATIVRNGTEFRIGVIPLGGYVQIDGLNPHDGTDPNAPDSYNNRPAHLRIATIFAGPAVNYAVGFLLLFAYNAFLYTRPLAPVRALKVIDGAPAAKAGLKDGDLVVGTSSVTFGLAEELLAAIQGSNGQPLTLVVRRDGVDQRLTVVPEGTPLGGYRVGVEYEGTGFRDEPMGVVAGAAAAAERVWTASLGSVTMIPRLFTKAGLQQVSGPIGMVKSLGKSMQSSLARTLGFIAEISIMLGVWNLLPFPSLDGSRLLFLFAGLARRKPVDRKLESLIHAGGFVLLIAFLLVVSFGDVTR